MAGEADPNLLESWLIHLRSDGKSAQTIDSYETGVRQFVAWCGRHGHAPALDRATVNRWVADLLATRSRATVAARLAAVRLFSAWAVDEGVDGFDRDELLGMKRPKLETVPVEPLSEADLRALLGSCKGKTFLDRRDDALIRFLLETGARASEAVNMLVSEVNLRDGSAVIRRGKGGKGRIVPFSAHCARSLDRYLRIRRQHRHAADTDQLWLGGGNRTFSYDGLWRSLSRRARLAGVKNFHPHRMRHTAATRWRAAGGSEGGLMTVAGWSRREMLDRYVQYTAYERAADESRGLNLGDL